LVYKNINIKIHRSIILPVVLYGYETWSLTLRKEHRLKVSYKMGLRILEPKRDKGTDERRKLQNKELNDPYCSPNIIRVIKYRNIRWAGHVARLGERRGTYRI